MQTKAEIKRIGPKMKPKKAPPRFEEPAWWAACIDREWDWSDDKWFYVAIERAICKRVKIKMIFSFINSTLIL